MLYNCLNIRCTKLALTRLLATVRSHMTIHKAIIRVGLHETPLATIVRETKSSKCNHLRFCFMCEGIVANVDAMKSSGFKGTNLSNEMNLINSNNIRISTSPAIFYSMCYAPVQF
jgi:hypothetical protein